MITFRARFDGRVLIPQEPVNLPTDRALEIHVADSIAIAEGESIGSADLVKLIECLPPLSGPKTDRAAQHDRYLYGHQRRP